MGSTVSIAAGEIRIAERRTRVLLALLDVLAVPLANARAAGVGKNNTASRLEGLDEAVASDGSTDLLGTGGDREARLKVDAVVSSLLRDVGRAGHVLVRRVRARADESDLELLWPSVLDNLVLELGKRCGKVGREGTVDVRLKLGEVLRNDVSIKRRPRIAQRTISIIWS